MNILQKLVRGLRTKSVGFAQWSPFSPFRLDKWGASDQLDVYSKSSYVYTCVRLRAEKVGMAEFELHDRRGNLIEEHPIIKLLNRPNLYQNKNEFFETYQMHKDLTGSVFVLIIRDGEGTPVELHTLRPDAVKILHDEAGLIIGYEYNVNGTKTIYKADDVFFSLSPSPLSPFIGHSPLTPGQLSVDTEMQFSQYQANVLKNGGRVEGVFMFKGEMLTEDQQEKIQEDFSHHFAGAEQGGKPLVLSGDADYKNLGLTPTELSYLESKKMTRDDILLLYRVPKALVAQTDGVNYANAKMAKSIFLSEVIKPLLDGLSNKLNEFLVPEELTLSFIDPTPEDIDVELKKIESGLQNHYMTINEAREARGLDRVPDGDDLLLPFNLVPLGQAEPDISDAEEDTGEDGEDVEEDNSQFQRGLNKKSDDPPINPLRNKDTRQKYAERWIKIADKREEQFIKELNKYWNQQLKRILEKLDSAPKHWKQKLIDDAWNQEVEVKTAKEFVLPIITEFLKESGQDILELFGSRETFEITSTLQTMLDQKASIFARSINETTFIRLKREFVESIEAQENRKQLIKRIKQTYGDIKESRARTIARTESTAASQMGVLNGYQQVGVTKKIWVSTPDSRTRDTHKDLDGVEVPLNQRFPNGLLFPGDPSGPPSEVINCRCSI